MARSRNIKPGFFTNDMLGELPPLARLLFAGLWTHCDREGRCEDRPKKIKAEVLPYDQCDADELLELLHQAGFIDRYMVGELRVIQVLTWEKHQNPHIKEAASTLPARSEHRTSTVPARCEHQPEPERAGLIPSSLIPDSLFLDSLKEKTSSNEDVRSQPAAESRPPLALAAPKPAHNAYEPPDCPHMAILDLWAEVLPTMPRHKPAQWKGTRADQLRARWRETATEKRWETGADGMAYLRGLFAHVGESRFLTGRTPARDDRGPFFVTLEWLASPKNWAKVVEGNYHREIA